MMQTQQTGAVMAEFFERRGMPVYRAAGAFWTPFSPGSRFLMTVPEQVSVDESHEELARLLWRRNLLAARFPTMARRGVEGGYYVWHRRELTLSSLDRKLRNTVRRAQEQCRLRPLEAGELIRDGLALNLDTMARQERFNPEFGEEANWRRFVQAVYDTPGMSVTGAFVNDELAAYSVELRADGWWYGLYQNSRTSLLKSFPNQALDYYSLERAAQDSGVEGVLNSPLPLSPNPGLHDYKSKFGYEVAPYRIVIQLHPLVDPLPNSECAKFLLRRAHEVAPNNRRILQAARFWAGVALPDSAPDSAPDPAMSSAAASSGWRDRFASLRAQFSQTCSAVRQAAEPGVEAAVAKYAIGVAFAGGATLLAVVLNWTSTNPLLWGTYLAWAMVTCTMKIRFPGVNGSVGANFVVTLLSFTHLSFSEAVSIAVLSTLAECYWRPLEQPSKLQAAFNVATLALSASAGYAVHVTAEQISAATPLVPLVAAAMTLFLCNTLLVAGVLGRVTHQSVGSVWRRCHLWTFPYYLFGSVAAAIVTHAHLPQSWLASFLVIPAMYLAHQFWAQVVDGMRPRVDPS